MKGRVRLSGRGEGEVTFDRSCTVGSSVECDLKISSDGGLPLMLKIEWNARAASWMLSYEEGGDPVGVEDSIIRTRGEERPIFSPTSIQIGENSILFDSMPDSPILGGKLTKSGENIPLKGKQRIEIGRGDREVEGGAIRLQLDKQIRKISSLHTILEKRDDFWYITNCGSNDTILNGQAFDTSRLVFGDRFKIGPYLFGFYVDHLKRLDDQNPGTIQARGLERVVEKVDEESKRRVKIKILSNVDLDIQSGEFVAIIGGSGQGKSTLMNALCGVAPATSGGVWINENKISNRSSIMSAGIGFVPQDDIVHRELRVIDAITTSAKLKLKLPSHEIQSLTKRIMDLLDLTEHQTKQIRRLSGGQRKRVSIATEMLSSPSVLFLDEPTSGLDPATESELMTTLQRLAEAGTTVVCTTHMLENAHICKRFIIVQEGRVIFDGLPGSAREYFLGGGKNTDQSSRSSSSFGGGKLASYSKIFKEIKGARKSGADWEDEFRASTYKRSFKPVAGSRSRQSTAKLDSVRKVGFWKVYSLLAKRQWKIVSSDSLNLVFLFAQASLIGFLIAWVAESIVLRGFLAVVATMWFGCSNGAQQIVGELSIFRRERISGQGINSYICSKFGFLSFLTTLQAGILFTTIFLTAFILPNGSSKAVLKFEEMRDGKGDKFEELLLSRVFSVPEEGAELAEEISVKLMVPVIDSATESELERPPSVSTSVAGPGLVESVSVPGLILGVSRKDYWEPGKEIQFPHGEVLRLPDELPEYPVDGFVASEVAPGMARSPFLKEGGWSVFTERQRERSWKPGAEVICNITQQTYRLPESLPRWRTETLRYRMIYGFLRFFSLEDAILDSNTVFESSRNQGDTRLGEGASGELELLPLVLRILGLKVGALLFAGTVGVSIGLMISALVQNSTQAVLWVPLILIPQILFGGFVVKIPEMSPSVRAVSFFFPSHAAQRVMDVSHIYGRIVPKISNKTKMPVFTEGDGEKIEWYQRELTTGKEKKKSEKFQKEVRENAAWQNLLIVPSRMGQHEIEGNFIQVFEADGSFKTSIRQEPDTVDARRDIHSLYFQGIRYVRYRDAQVAMIILTSWIFICYFTILGSLTVKQTGQ